MAFSIPRPINVPPAIGYAFLALGITLVLATFLAFRRWHTPIMPFSEPTHCITNGPFVISRNPLYLGEVLMLIGLAALHKHPVALLPISLFIAVIDRYFIRAEESLLQKAFGPSYSTYKLKVRKWV